MSLLGKTLGKIVGSGIKKLTGGLIAPKINFSPASMRPQIAPTIGPDSTVTRNGIFWGMGGSSTTSYFGKTPAGQASGGSNQGMALAAGKGCGVAWTGTHWRAQRLNKSTYITRGGGTSRWPTQLIVHPAGSECVTVRRRHVTNAKALRRAISRVRGFVKVYRKAAALVIHHHRPARAGKK